MFAVFIFATELLRVDVAAMLIMTLLGLLIFVPGLKQLLTPDVIFSGFSSNAVISIIGVMILGGGLDKTGAMERVAWAILRYGGKTEKRIVALLTGTVAIISSFMQNVGAAALILLFVFCYIFTQGREGTGVMEGVRYGALIGVLVALPTSVDAFVIYPITEQLSVIWFVSTVVTMMIAGALFSAIYKPSGG